MAYPNPPEIMTSYTAAEQALGNGTLPGQELDVDLAAVRASITTLIEFVKGITRSDGKLANGIVTSESLGSSLIIGFDPPAPWMTGAGYTTSSTVFEGFGFYLCVAAHTSTDFLTDLASGRWVLLADLTPPGGALIAANNLTDLPDISNARANLGLGSMATAASGTGAAQHRTNLENDARFQPLAANLTAWAALVGAANQLGYFTGAGTAALTGLTAFARTLLDDADAATARTTLGAQASDADLTALAALSAVGVLLRTGAGTASALSGTAGHVLTAQGAGVAPTFAASTAIGVGQTWQDVIGSRVRGTSYRNTTGRPIMVAVTTDGSGTDSSFEVSANNTTWIVVASAGAGRGQYHVIIPDTWYYRANGSESLDNWVELR